MEREVVDEAFRFDGRFVGIAVGKRKMDARGVKMIGFSRPQFPIPTAAALSTSGGRSLGLKRKQLL